MRTSPSDAEAYVEAIGPDAMLVDDPPRQDALASDPDDEFLIDLARAAQVDALVSGDARLLELRGRLPVLSPREFLESLDRS
ncbi:MAG: hypothetical protein U0667_18040 [Chloroflexota bacterium]